MEGWRVLVSKITISKQKKKNNNNNEKKKKIRSVSNTNKINFKLCK